MFYSHFYYFWLFSKHLRIVLLPKPGYTQVQVTHRQTREGDAQQMTTVDSIYIFQSSCLPPASLGMGCSGACNPGTQKDSSKTAPHNAPDCLAMCEVSTAICHQHAVTNERDQAGIDKGSLKQVVEKDQKQHYGGGEKKITCYYCASYWNEHEGVKYTWPTSIILIYP